MLVYCRLCVCNLFIRAGNRGRWPASVKLVTLPYLITLSQQTCNTSLHHVVTIHFGYHVPYLYARFCFLG